MLIKQGKTNIKYLLILVILAVIVGGGVWWFNSNIIIDNYVPEECQYSENGEVLITGTVTKNYKEKLEVDGPAWIEVNTDTCLARVEYHPGEAECKNMDTLLIGLEIQPGDEVDVYGKFYGGYIHTCDHDSYFIHKLEGPVFARWETYRNEEYGFELEYLKDWNMKSDFSFNDVITYLKAGVISFYPYEVKTVDELVGFFNIIVFKTSTINIGTGWLYPSQMTLREFIELRRGIEKDFYFEVETETNETILNGIPSIKEENKNVTWETEYGPREGEMVIYYLNREKDGRKFGVSYSCLTMDKNKCQNIFNQMLSTFRFLD